MKKLPRIVLLACLTFISSLFSFQSFSGSLNLPSNSNGGTLCIVTKNVDDENVIGSLRRALNQGYNIHQSGLPNLCSEKIVFEMTGILYLHDPILLNSSTQNGFTLEKSTTIAGNVVLDASNLPEGSCAITVDAAHITLRNFNIQNAKGGNGICMGDNARATVIDHVDVSQSGNGIWGKPGAHGNIIQNGAFHDNTGFGINLENATQNTVTQNALYRNNLGPLSSPLTSPKPELLSGAPNNETATEYTISGRVGAVVDRIEVFRKTPNGSTTNYIKTLQSNEFQGLNFITTLIANSGEEIFAISITSDGSTSSVSNLLLLSPGIASQGTNATRSCFFGQVFPTQIDFDHDGIPDYLEDKNKNCIVDVGETDPTRTDTDGDGIPDGVEDRNHNGTLDTGETDPARIDTDGDGIPDGVEDANHNGLLDYGESSPLKADTDDDGIPDYVEDADRNGHFDANETKTFMQDTDLDGLEDGAEDANHNGVVDMLETDPRSADTDGDGLIDSADPCPKVASLLCQHPCIVGQVPSATLDTDRDAIPDAAEDFNHNCIRDPGETDVYLQDTDGDGLVDSADPCPRNPDHACISACIPGGFVPANRDSDSDGLFNVQEDKNGNCAIDPGESNPFDHDSDDDGIPDNVDQCPLDPNPVCSHPCVAGQIPPSDLDSDGDAIPDHYEDLNHNCIQDGHESDFRQRDTDHDGLYDNQDPCSNNPDLTCISSCIPGEFVPPTKDSDRDGIPDSLEDLNNNCLRDINETNAFATDTDGDGISDGAEDRNHNGHTDSGETNPLLLDTDGDGISDGLEDRNHNGVVDFGESNPNSLDSDADAIPDRLEDVNLNGVSDKGETSAYLADTDQDGAKDGEEDKNHNGRVDAGESDPRNPDSDGDGASDGQELSQGTNPIHASTSDLNQAIGKGSCMLNAGSSSLPYGTILLWAILFISFSIRKRTL